MPVFSAQFTITAAPPPPPAASATPMLVNGTDLGTLGFVLTAAPGWRDAPPRSTPSVVRPGRAGAYRSAATQENARKVTLQGVVRGASAALARATIDAIRALLIATQPATLTFPDDATRFVSGYLDQFVTDIGNGPSMIATALGARLDFSLLDPYAYDVTPQTLVNGARAPLGTAPSFPVFTITGAAINPSLALYRYDGTILATMGLTLTCVAGDVLVIDMDRKTIMKNGVSVLSALTTGDFIVMDPALAQNGLGVSAGDQPYLLGATGSTGTGSYTYRRAWR
jgi:phage-related protein